MCQSKQFSIFFVLNSVKYLSIRVERSITLVLENTHDIFFKLIDELKSQGLHASIVGTESGIKAYNIRNWRSRGHGAKEEHIHKLIETYPHRLKGLAEELGILKKPLHSAEEQFKLLLKKAHDELAEMEEKLRQVKDESDETVQTLQQENDRLKAQVEILQKLVESKIKGQ